MVRERLGLPHKLVWRHPFPGPGIGVRVLCSEGGESSDDFKELYEQVAAKAGSAEYDSMILPVRSVGVQGDSRTYAHPAAVDGILDWEKLELLSTDVTNEIQGVNRVVFKIGGGELKPLKSKASTLTRDRLNLLREADYEAVNTLKKYNLYKSIFQMPVILLPLSTDGEKECVVIRPLESSDVMTARFYRMPEAYINEIARRIMALGSIEYVFYDITNKPPGTFEWE
jgi:GMP synthase (glutamine-hydrolysing)